MDALQCERHEKDFARLQGAAARQYMGEVTGMGAGMIQMMQMVYNSEICDRPRYSRL